MISVIIPLSDKKNKKNKSWVSPYFPKKIPRFELRLVCIRVILIAISALMADLRSDEPGWAVGGGQCAVRRFGARCDLKALPVGYIRRYDALQVLSTVLVLVRYLN